MLKTADPEFRDQFFERAMSAAERPVVIKTDFAGAVALIAQCGLGLLHPGCTGRQPVFIRELIDKLITTVADGDDVIETGLREQFNSPLPA